jgi:hypothetical protein
MPRHCQLRHQRQLRLLKIILRQGPSDLKFVCVNPPSVFFLRICGKAQPSVRPGAINVTISVSVECESRLGAS